MIKQNTFKKIYWLKNFETGENLTFAEDKVTEEQLKEYNEKGYNIYQTVNTFTGNKRQVKDLAEIRACFIDIDYPEIVEQDMDKESRAEFIKKKYEEVQSNLKKIKEFYNIEPSVINLTYKGFHILFNYHEDCFFIDENLHQEINNKLIEILGGDQNAKDLARIYKIPGFYDWKGGKKGKIKSLLNKDSELITIDKFKSIINKDLIFRKEDKIEKKSKGDLEKNAKILKNIEKINSIDALIFLEKLTEIFLSERENKKTKFNQDHLQKLLNKLKYEKDNSKYILMEEDGTTRTNGLFIEQDLSGIWKINDYSKKTRRGNYNFLKNWIFLNSGMDFSGFIKVLYKSTGLTLNSNLSRKSLIDAQVAWNHHYGRIGNKELKNVSFDVTKTDLAKELNKDNQELLKNVVKEYSETAGFSKVFRALFSCIKEEIVFNKAKFADDGSIVLELNEFAKEYLGIEEKDLKNHKSDLLFLIEKVGKATFPYKNEKIVDGKKEETFGFKSVLEIEYSNKKGRGNKKQIYIKPINNSNLLFSKLPFYFNKNILSYQPGFKDTRVTDWFIKVDDVLSNTTHPYSENLDIVYETLGYTGTLKSNKFNLTKHLQKGIEKGFFADYKIKDNKLTISKFPIE